MWIDVHDWLLNAGPSDVTSKRSAGERATTYARFFPVTTDMTDKIQILGLSGGKYE